MKWKLVEGYNKYEVSNTGKIRSYHKWRKFSYREMIPSCGKDGYYRVSLSNNGSRKSFLIHRVVAMAFVTNPKPHSYTEVNHKDGDKSNNNSGNLE